MVMLTSNEISNQLQRLPRLKKQVIRYQNSIIREIVGVYGIQSGRLGKLDVLQGAELHDLVAGIENAFSRSFKTTRLLRNPIAILEFNSMLPDQHEIQQSSPTLQSQDTEDNEDNVEKESQLLNSTQPLTLLEARYSEKLLFRGILSDGKEVSKEDRKTLDTLKRDLESILNKFLDCDWLRLDSLTVIFNPRESRALSPKRGNTSKASNSGNGSDPSSESPVSSSPRHKWGDVVLSNDLEEKLNEFFFEFTHSDFLYSKSGRNLESVSGRQAFVLNLHGPPGTGKSTLAHSIASRLGKNIIEITYAQIENALVGEAAKTLNRTFKAAEDTHSILFVDEADSLLSHRPTSFSHGADYHISSLRSELFTEISKFRGILVLATNNANAYDKAFVSRISLAVELPLPDSETRKRIWMAKLPPCSTKSEIFDYGTVAEASDGLSGRDIQRLAKRSVICASMRNLQHPVETELATKLITQFKADLDSLAPSAMLPISRIPGKHRAGEGLSTTNTNEGESSAT